MKYANVIDTKLQGWYDSEIHSEIPTPNIEVTEEVWQEAININANCYENGKFIVKDFRTDTEIEEVLDDTSDEEITISAKQPTKPAPVKKQSEKKVADVAAAFNELFNKK